MAPSSSPLSSPPPSEQKIRRITTTPAQRQYRPAQALPFELAQHVQIYFEEQLFAQAFSFLLSLVSSGAASASLSMPTMVPSPAHLAIALTVAVHPTFTTRTTSGEKLEQANAALRLLRQTNKILGPINADFQSAFVFKKYDFRSSRNGGRRSNGDEEIKDSTFEQKINSPYAGTESLLNRAEDFWQNVGWAFNCSCLEGMHRARWIHWNLWLDFMLQVFEDDLTLRSPENYDESLIWQYVELASSGHGKNRRILRAIFADGSAKSLNEFKEVFNNELKEATKDADKLKKREVNVNIEEDIYGDYMTRDDDEDVDDEPAMGSLENASNSTTRGKRSRPPSSRRITPRTSNSSLRSDASMSDAASLSATASSHLGPPISIMQRLRLLSLLSRLSLSIPESFLELDELYTLFVEFIKPLPLLTFQAIILPSSSTQTGPLSPDELTTLCEFMLQRMLETSAPDTCSDRAVTQRKLERNYLPFAASRGDVQSNAKLSLLLESLMRELASANWLKRTEELASAVAAGVKRRYARVGEGRKGGGKEGKGDGEDGGVAWCWLVESGKRMERMIKALPS